MIFTSSSKKAREFENRLPCGNVGVNVDAAAAQAFATLGSFKNSFYGGLHGVLSLCDSSQTGK